METILCELEHFVVCILLIIVFICFISCERTSLCNPISRYLISSDYR